MNKYVRENPNKYVEAYKIGWENSLINSAVFMMFSVNMISSVELIIGGGVSLFVGIVCLIAVVFWFIHMLDNEISRMDARAKRYEEDYDAI